MTNSFFVAWSSVMLSVVQIGNNYMVVVSILCLNDVTSRRCLRPPVLKRAGMPEQYLPMAQKNNIGDIENT